ncbi:hypothetical protein G9A89_012662 [Geosiphon pyriformis]|nr:hypothetical protein G9A89_012662 [Geosiphon pyriformis]
MSIILQKTSTNNNHPKVTELEIIEANHLEFVKSLFQQYSQQLELNNNYFPVESAFNFYVNNKITDCLGETVDIEFTRENFYTELFQYISLPKNYSFTPIIRKINQTIERYTQQQFLITYADKGKERLQTPAITPKQIQPLTWKKTRVELPTNPSYHYTPRSTINISSIRKYEFLRDNGIRKKKKKEAKDQKFTYQNSIPENLNIETLNIQTQQNPNLENPEIKTPNFQTQQNWND